MNRKIFKFKKFEIEQDLSVMKVGTDGVLIGAVCECSNVRKILDIGTGTGLIALMLAQRSKALIDCIDINKCAVDLAGKNISSSPWNDRISVFYSSLQDFNPVGKYDLIVSNPPYFFNGMLASDKNRALARHSTELSYSDFSVNVSRLLDDEGKFYVIYPVEQSSKFESFANENGMYPDLKIMVYPRQDLPVVRIISRYSKKKAQVVKEDTIIIENNVRHSFTEQYKELTGVFYLKF
jgi:tRNA1Val (adenine37-N6)-methyltransferase